LIPFISSRRSRLLPVTSGLTVAGQGVVAQTVGVSRPEAYVFGHSEVEFERLAFQSELVGPITRRLLVEAGVTSGMRVLDVGTGRGDRGDFLGQQVTVVVFRGRAPAPAVQMAAIVGAGANCGAAAKRLTGLIATLLPVIEERGLAESGELDSRTLAEQLVRDVTATASFAVAPSEVTAWTSV
jgi:hypothetical protein